MSASLAVNYFYPASFAGSDDDDNDDGTRAPRPAPAERRPPGRIEAVQRVVMDPWSLSQWSIVLLGMDISVLCSKWYADRLRP